MSVKNGKPFFVSAVILTLLSTFSIAQTPFSTDDLNPETLPRVSGEITDNHLIVIYNIPEDQHQVIQPEFNFMDITPEDVPGLAFGETIYPDGETDKNGLVEYHGITVLKKEITYFDPSKIDKDTLMVMAGYQFCLEDGTCLMPGEETLKLSLSELIIGEAVTNRQSGNTGLLVNLLFAFLGGIILNVMPCVFPVLSIKIMSLVGSARQDTKEILKGSLVYTAGILVSFFILGLSVVILKLAGQSVGWGFQFQNVGFVIFLLTLIWVFGLSLFDVFVIQLPGMPTATKASSKKGHAGSFFSGVFAVLLATPCTAPLLGAALGWAFAQPPLIILLSFLIIGLGLAFPFILIGFFPGLIKWIPKPGPWMDTFKNIMAFLLMATVIYLVRVLYFMLNVQLINVFWYMLFVAVSLWILGHFASPVQPKRKRSIATLVALVIAIGSGFYFLRFDAGHSTESVQTSENGLYQRDPHHPGWYVFQPELVEALRDENKPVFLDFAAEWCLTCKTNEAAVLFTDEIQNVFKEKGVYLLRGDNTKKNPVILQWLEKFNRAGVPLYVLYLPDQEEPIVLPEVITKEMILNQLEKIGTVS